MTVAEQLLVKHGARHSAGNEYVMKCPFHSDSDPSLSVNTAKGVFICFGCGAKGRIGRLVRKLTHGTVAVQDTESVSTSQPRAEITLPSDYTPLWQKPRSQYGRLALEYLSSRGITRDQLEKFRIGYCGNGYYTGRLIIPVYTKGQLLSFVARDFTGRAERKVKYPVGSRSSEGLFGYDQMIHEGRLRKCVVITEGWADALAVDRQLTNGTGVLALGSNHLSLPQMRLVEKVPRFVVLLDNDGPGHTGSLEVCNMLSVFCNNVSRVLITGCKDPGDAPPDLLRKVLITSGCFK